MSYMNIFRQLASAVALLDPIPVLLSTDGDFGASGRAGTVDIFPSTALKGKNQFAAAANAGNTTNTVTNASQAAARTFTMWDPGASAAFKMMALQAITTDGAITIKDGMVLCNKAGVLALTLADPVATTDDGKMLVIMALQAQANTVTNTTGFGAGGGSLDVATFGGAIGDNMMIVAYQAKWYVISTRNVTLG